MNEKKEDYHISPILKEQIKKIIHAVTKKDRDFVLVIDGEEGSGKSVLAMQIAKALDPNFNIDNIVFTSDQFLELIKKTPKYSCVLLDEAFSAASSRAALTEVNRSMVGVATEMRQRNLYIIIVLPSFFDLDKYFALWRCRALLHVYFQKDGGRGNFVIFPKTSKKFLYLNGKKTYSYAKPKSPFPPCRFDNYYTVDETEYRLKKANAFKKRTISNQAARWRGQRDGLICEMYHNLNVKTSEVEKMLIKWGKQSISQREIERIVQLKEEIGESE
jgi:ABC-type dipeptide/oligopeptide/nickel transport system ATPase component